VEPTVILQDLVMPDIDGLTLVRYFRVHERLRDVPLIVLSTKEDPRVKAEAFALGANDYLVKLPDEIELVARIRYHSRGYINLLQRNEAMRRLTAELAEAAEYVRQLLPPPITSGPLRTDWRFLPSTSLGGDTFGYHWLDDEHFAVFLLDVCGHGVGAALLSVSVMNVLRERTLPEVDFRIPGQVLSGLNEAFQMERHNGMYFTIWYGVYAPASRRLTYASGGHPAALLFETGATAPERVATPGFIVGALPSRSFPQGERELTPGSRLLLFSDGIYELPLANGDVGSYDDLLAVVAAGGPDDVVERIEANARALVGEGSLPDDFSILTVDFR
jgi:sigma-B regulation protein RsbU (phosphoserine phosphatase)